MLVLVPSQELTIANRKFRLMLVWPESPVNVNVVVGPVVVFLRKLPPKPTAAQFDTHVVEVTPEN